MRDTSPKLDISRICPDCGAIWGRSLVTPAQAKAIAQNLGATSKPAVILAAFRVAGVEVRNGGDRCSCKRPA